MTLAYCIAGYLLGVLSLALVLGAIADLSDRTEVKQPEPEPLYVPQEWWA